MLELSENIQEDIDRVGRIPIVPSMLEVICRTTGMGFAVIAKVTKERWIACGVRDEIDFGLKVGGELEVKSTICDEIRDSGNGVVIDHVAEDPVFCTHHTPLQYGLQSYISLPIFLRDGQFFGTLCAIDPRPAKVNNPQTIGMFTLFAQLIAFHIDALRDKEDAERRLQQTAIQLRNYKDEINQYRNLSDHNLQEPIRKIRLFSDLLISSEGHREKEKITETAEKINLFAGHLSEMIRQLSAFGELDSSEKSFELTELQLVLFTVLEHLDKPLRERDARITTDIRHRVKAVPSQMARMFNHLLTNSLKYTPSSKAPQLRISSKDFPDGEAANYPGLSLDQAYCQLLVEDMGIGIDSGSLQRIFDISTHINASGDREGFDIDLAQCRKIVQVHGGVLSAHPRMEGGILFSIILPMERE